LIGGLGIIVMGWFNLFTSRVEVDCGHDHGDADNAETPAGPVHSHSHDGSVVSRAFTLLLLSGAVAGAAALTPDQFSERFLLLKAAMFDLGGRDGARFKQENPGLVATPAKGFTLEDLEKTLRRTKDGNFPLSVPNLQWMASDAEYARVMEGQMVETAGQVVLDQINPGPGNLRVMVMETTCCAADARPSSIPVLFEGEVPEFISMGWYKVTGEVRFARERGMKVVRLVGKSLTPAIRPSETFRER
jgi:uncharacterized membrane protein YcgQ (UPF0703/DUF1980 family)